MSIDVEICATCDECGKSMYEGDAVVLCEKCAGDKAQAASTGLASGWCEPVIFNGTYTCLATKQDFEWSGELPEFCPRCGKPIRNRW